jgi:hypothetical protein
MWRANSEASPRHRAARLLLDAGARRAQVFGLKLADVDLELDVLLMLG